MLVEPGKVGAIAIGSKAATTGFVPERIVVLNAKGRQYGVWLGAYNANGRFVSCMRWAENANDAHFLLTPDYVPGSMKVLGKNGVEYVFPEPVEVNNSTGQHFYIQKVVISADAVQYQVIY